jgi:energy-coupling factor transporter transmembrane protein EcfT
MKLYDWLFSSFRQMKLLLVLSIFIAWFTFVLLCQSSFYLLILIHKCQSAESPLFSRRCLIFHFCWWQICQCPDVQCDCYNNNNQTFYSQASWGRLEMKPHESKNRDKTRAKKKGETNHDKKTNRKRRKGIKTLSA